MDFKLLKSLCAIRATSGDEGQMTDFILNYIKENSKSWKVQPKVFSGAGFQDVVILVFGKPTVAVFAHIDSIGYATAYENKIVKIGGPKAKNGSKLLGEFNNEVVECELEIKSKKGKDKKEDKEELTYKAEIEFERGTPLAYKPIWRETENYVQCCYLDNRLGVFNSLQLAAEAENVALVFGTYEEHGGGTAQFAGKFLQEKYGIRQALISDISLISEGIKHKQGVVISMRDRGIPRQSYVRKIISLAKKHKINHQLEVESAGGSDGNMLQASSFLWDWCFIGAAEANYHTPEEKVHKNDIKVMLDFYKVLIKEL